jgi:dCMP deaminase
MLSTEYILKQLKEITFFGACQKRKVGCLIVSGNNVLIKAFNGMPEESGLSCIEGDCPRCRTEISFPHGVGYDLCFCLHAEEKAIADAARQGISLEGTVLYTSYQPCIMCLKKIAQCGIQGVRYIEPWEIPNTSWGVKELNSTYKAIANSLKLGVQQLELRELG